MISSYRHRRNIFKRDRCISFCSEWGEFCLRRITEVSKIYSGVILCYSGLENLKT